MKDKLTIYKKIDEWSDKYTKASSNFGKWYCQIQIDKWKKKLQRYESKS